MGFYQIICYKVEDFFVKIISKKQDTEIVKEKVNNFRIKRENHRIQSKITDK